MKKQNNGFYHHPKSPMTIRIKIECTMKTRQLLMDSILELDKHKDESTYQESSDYLGKEFDRITKRFHKLHDELRELLIELEGK